MLIFTVFEIPIVSDKWRIEVDSRIICKQKQFPLCNAVLSDLSETKKVSLFPGNHITPTAYFILALNYFIKEK